MKIFIDTLKIEDVNQFGEVLREHCFDSTHCATMTGYHKPHECYSTFSLNPDFKFFKLLPTNPIYKKLARLSGFNESDGRLDFFAFSNNIIDIGWWWDGDGTLIISEGGKTAINNDCKCDYTWEWV